MRAHPRSPGAGLLLCGLLAWPASPAADEVVQRFGDGVVALAARADATPAERLEACAALVADACDPRAATEAALGAAWDPSATPDVGALLAEAVAARLAARAERGADAFAVGESRAAADGSLAVSARLTRGDETVDLSFHLVGEDGARRIAGIEEDGESWLVAPAWGGDAAGLADRLAAEARHYAASPAEAIERLHAALLSAMKAAAPLGYEGRYARLAPVVEDTHDMEAIARLTLSRAWSELAPEQRAEFVGVFRELSVATYAGRFDSWSGERFEAVSDKAGPKSSWIVKTRLVKSDGEEIPFEYQMIRRAGRWRVLNIIVDGVSDVATKRAEYKSVLERDGFAKLVAELRRQAAEQAAEG